MKRLIYHIGRFSEADQLRLDILDGLSRTIHERITLGFIPMRLPVIDEVPYRIFDSTREYRQWAHRNLPRWLGYYCTDD